MRDGSYNLAIDASEDCDQLYSNRSYKMKSARQDKKASDKNDGKQRIAGATRGQVYE